MELPISFIEATRSLLGTEEYTSFERALAIDPSVSIRINPRRPIAMPDGNQAVPWCTNGFYLEKRPTFTFDPFLHAGMYYVQEASSMFLWQVVRSYVKEPVVALDMCAAPGGKSTLLCDALPEGSLLVSNEYVRSRAQILAENITKWGTADVVITNNGSDAFAALKNCFDFILVDAPCSGEGMFRKDETAIREWSPANVLQCVERQRSILSDVWQSLKPGGILVYSTCTFNLYENEGNVKWLQDTYEAEVLPVSVAENWGITSSLATDCSFPVYRFMPHKTKGEGLFMAVVRKPLLDEIEVASKKKKNKNKVKEQPIPKECKYWLSDAEGFSFFWHDERIMALSRKWQQLWGLLSEQLHVLQAGVPVASCKGRDLIPEHALALSNQKSTIAFPEAELTYAQALAYLRKEAIVLASGVPKGFVTVTYKGAALGWVKNLGNRANNLYPEQWRIRSGYQPEELILISDWITHK